MHDEKPPPWLAREVIRLFAGYPSASMSSATIDAFAARLRGIRQDAVEQAFRAAPETSPTFCPSAEVVRQIALSRAKSIETSEYVKRSEGKLLTGKTEPEQAWHGDPEMLKRIEHIKNTYTGEDLAREMFRLVLAKLDGKLG